MSLCIKGFSRFSRFSLEISRVCKQAAPAGGCLCTPTTRRTNDVLCVFVHVFVQGGVREREHLRCGAEGPWPPHSGAHGALLPAGGPGDECLPSGGALRLCVEW